MTNTILTMASLDYMKAGLHVLALTGKKPNPRVHGDGWSYEDSFHGSVDSPEEMDLLDHAFSKEWGTTGIAICIPPGMLVADVDTDRAGALLTELGWAPTEDSVVAQTKNGLHVWFVEPTADRNRWLGDGQDPNPGRTLLFKGLGGYVVAPPSLHFGADGEVDGQYTWLPGSALVVGGRLQFADILPAGARERFRRQDLWAEDREGGQKPVSSWHYNADPEKPWWAWPVEWSYQLDGLERAIVKAADGNQNNVIHWAAMTAAEEGVPFDVAMERLMDAARKGNHPENRARDTIRGAYKMRRRA